jgi:hypothetical protein
MLVFGDMYGKLPLFPSVYAPVTEERVERMVERMMDIGDAIFMRGDATQAQYDAWVVQLDRYARELLAQA